MSDRLQIYNKTQGFYITIAKGFSGGMTLGNTDLLGEFFNKSSSLDYIVTVKDWEGIEDGAEDLNVTNKWETAKP